MTRSRLVPRSLLIAIAASALLGLLVTSALALDDAKPAPGCHGVLAEDGKADGADSFAVPFRTSDAVEIQRTFFKYDAAKGAEGLTLNMVVKDLSLTVPSGATGMIWDFKWLAADGATHFIRAVVDYTGGSAFEYGTLDDSLPLQRYVPEGSTTGKFFIGPDGVVQLGIPAAVAKPGDTIKSLIGEAQLALQIVPSAIQTPSRGLSNLYDDTAGKTLKLAECTPEQVAGGGVLPGVTRALPVKLTTTSASAKKLKKAKSVSLKVSASEKVTQLTAKLLKGRTAYGKGSLAELNGAGKLKLKLSKKLKKGSYTLNLTGTDSTGSKLTSTAKFKVK